MFMGYRCNSADLCPNKKCLHRSAHLERKSLLVNGNYLTCVNQHAYCSHIHDFVICKNIAEREEEKEKWQSLSNSPTLENI